MRSRALPILAVLAISAAIAAGIAARPARPPAAPAPTAEATSRAAISVTGSATGAAPDEASPAISATLSPAPTSSASPRDAAAARVVETAPAGVRAALDAAVSVTFEGAPDHAGVTLDIDPPAEGKLTWTAPQTLAFFPARWAEGKPYHVRVSGPSVAAPATFEFRTLVPPPEHVEPGRGERLTLTFDDGADRPAQVAALLDLLKKEGVEAIFFPIGRWAEQHPALVARMREEGHRVCNHTYSHQNLRLPQLTEEEIRSEIARGAGAGTCELFRPPLKAFDPRSERIIAQMGYTMYLWDIDSRDWEGAPAEDIVNLVLAKAHPGGVVLFHMHAEATLAALPVLLPRLRKAGYRLREEEGAGAPARGAQSPPPPPRPTPAR